MTRKPTSKSNSGPMVLAAFWARQAAVSVRIRVTKVTRALPPRPFHSERKAR